MQQQQQPDEVDRRNRFSPSHSGAETPTALRERAASQPPRTGETYQASPLRQSYGSPPGLGGASPWSQPRRFPSLSQSQTLGLPQSVPTATRSASFTSGANPQGNLLSTLRDARSFASTFEDDESEAFSDYQDTYDERYIPPSMQTRGRGYLPDINRSRSHSLAALRPGPIGSPLGAPGSSGMWAMSNPLNIPSNDSRYGDIPALGSRYGSLGAIGRSPTSYTATSPPGLSVANGHRQADISNISPFVRDVRQILLDDGSAFRELWAGMNPPRDENGTVGSGTTSRRHSVSVVQPRRGVVGFAGSEGPDEASTPMPLRSSFSQGGLMLSDDDLASDLLNLNMHDEPDTSRFSHPASQPSSLPIYAPHSRSPPSSDSRYMPLNLAIPGGSFATRHHDVRSPSDGGLSGGSNSPPRNAEYNLESSYASAEYATASQGMNARFVPGQGIQYFASSNGGGSTSPTYSRVPGPLNSNQNLSPAGSARPIQPQQSFHHQMQRSPSEAVAPALSELGKGVPLHAVPASCPLYIVEFKAGRTDLFYCTDPSVDVRTGDLVIVEADRGKDLGKIVNDSITLQEVEAFQRQQAKINYSDHGGPTSPGGAGPSPSGKRDINPKRIYGKAQPQDAQLLVSKIQDEVKALQLCQTKVRQKKLPMEVIDAEYQWDRRKLTFYFVAEKRIDFRELVRELFRLYKTRIWMASLQGPSFEQ